MHQKISYTTRLRHLENHTEAVDLYLMNRHLFRLNVEWISVISLLVIPWMTDLSGELSHIMKNGTYLNSDASKQWLGLHHPAKVVVKKSVLPQSNVCLVEF